MVTLIKNSHGGHVNTKVFFDNFTVTHSHSAIVQADDYYPFGLTFNSYRREDGMVNRYLYHSKELSLETGSYDFHARMYDPALGRTFQIDPHSESYFSLSGYSWVDNNPLVNMDPTGMDIQYGKGLLGGDLYTGEDMVKMLLSLQAQFRELNDGREKEKDKEKERKKEEARAGVAQSGGGTGSVHPADVMRPEGGGYGYVGVSEGRNGKTYYKMSDNYGKTFWVDKNWKGRPLTSFKFWNTYMGQDLQRTFPILKDPNNREVLGNTGQNIFEAIIEKLIRWPFPLPIYVPEEYKNTQGVPPEG